MKYLSPIHTTSWKDLKNHFEKIKDVHLIDFFKNHKNRFQDFSYLFQNIMLIDYSKNRITQDTLKKLFDLAREMNLLQQIEFMFLGYKINVTENKSVLHTALRNRSSTPIYLNGFNIMPDINSMLDKMKIFSDSIINGVWKGYSGKRIKYIVNIGIGGSDLGPKMVTQALQPYKNHLEIFYISNIDSTDVFKVLNLIEIESTIFLISSKNFSTQETLTNATTIKKYFVSHTGNTNHINYHFFAITANFQKAKKFGILEDNIFQMWDWVGGRYSLWSAMGLSIVLSIGFKNFSLLLDGAYAMDLHFRYTKIENNIPIILGLIGIWYNNFFNSETEGIFPYDSYLNYLPTYIQQSNMESNGKGIDKNGNPVCWQTGPIIWGEVGTNGQHSFYQLLHQGTKLIPSDFIAPVLSHNPIENHHKILLSNFFAQTHALAFGKNFTNNHYVKNNDNEINQSFIDKFKYFQGNRPSNSFLITKINPYSLGLLIALYEHKIFTQGVIFNVFSFDQWGVELGKEISNKIFNTLSCDNTDNMYDSSTKGLIDFYNTNNI